MSQEPRDRRKLDLRDDREWSHDANGDLVCPWCHAVVLPERAAFHQEVCPSAQPERRGRKEAGE